MESTTYVSRSERRDLRGSSFRIPERRTGFDRRRPDPLFRTLRDRTGLLLGLLVLLNVLNMTDWGLTAYALELGAAEGNPIMATAFAQGPVFAAIIKVAAMALVSVGIWRWRRYRAVLACGMAAGTVYTALLCYHLIGLSVIA